jgi:hypothetical protein
MTHATIDQGRRRDGASRDGRSLHACRGGADRYGGVVGWLVADEPIVATACVIAADLIGAAMMVPKTHRDPESETLVTFAFASLGGALAAGAVGSADLSLLLYPVYYCLINGAIALLIYHRRAPLRDRPRSPHGSGPGASTLVEGVS